MVRRLAFQRHCSGCFLWYRNNWLSRMILCVIVTHCPKTAALNRTFGPGPEPRPRRAGAAFRAHKPSYGDESGTGSGINRTIINA